MFHFCTFLFRVAQQFLDYSLLKLFHTTTTNILMKEKEAEQKRQSSLVT